MKADQKLSEWENEMQLYKSKKATAGMKRREAINKRRAAVLKKAASFIDVALASGISKKVIVNSLITKYNVKTRAARRLFGKAKSYRHH